MSTSASAKFSVLSRAGRLVGWYPGRIMGEGNGEEATGSDVVL